jgi:hypothetical protein
VNFTSQDDPFRGKSNPIPHVDGFAGKGSF